MAENRISPSDFKENFAWVSFLKAFQHIKMEIGIQVGFLEVSKQIEPLTPIEVIESD